MQIAVQTANPTESARFIELAPDLERAGLDAVWIGEAYGIDSLTTLGFIAARTTTMRLGPGILNVFSRSAGVIAMSMAGLDTLSGGRAMLGLGASGPAVIEGLHGVPFERPLSRTADYTEICRQLWRGERGESAGPGSRVPLREGQRGMRLLAPAPSGGIPVFWASILPTSVTKAAACADGWLPLLFMPERYEQAWGESLAAGRATRSDSLGPLEVAADVAVAIGEEYVGDAAIDVLAGHRAHLALHIGLMGPKGRNSYTTLACMLGFEAEANLVQDLYLGGKRTEAEAAIPAELLLGTALVGPVAKVEERLSIYRAAGVTMLNTTIHAPDEVRQVELLKTAVTNVG
jgi:F420-dependent oxidoreductase-like protein